VPTQPFEKLAPLDLKGTPAGDLFNAWADGIREAVNFGTQVLAWCWSKKPASRDLPLILSLRHALDMLDAISILLKEGAADACKLQLRSMLEVLFGVRYMLQKDTDKRNMAFMVWHVNSRLKYCKRLDPKRDTGKQFRQALKKDYWLRAVEIPDMPEAEQELRSRIEDLEALLQEPEYAAAEAEYKRTQLESKRRSMPWYSLYDGPRSIEDLARAVGAEGLYEVMYRDWSGIAHATDIIHGRISPGEELGAAALHQIRHPGDAQTVLSYALPIGLHLIRVIFLHYCPERNRDFQEWYVGELRDIMLVAGKEKLLDVN
jgi:hypothetical protein